MPEVVIVGAGLAGLTAAISCARVGHEVRVLEKYKQVGGAPDHHPSIDMTPMLPDRMGKFLGLDLKPPHVTPTASVRFIAYGKNYEVAGAPLFLQSVERGPRESSLETHLFKVARDCASNSIGACAPRKTSWNYRRAVSSPPGCITNPTWPWAYRARICMVSRAKASAMVRPEVQPGLIPSSANAPMGMM